MLTFYCFDEQFLFSFDIKRVNKIEIRKRKIQMIYSDIASNDRTLSKRF